MQRSLLLAAVAALALAAAPAAVAKEITKAEVCGTGGCVSVDDEAGRMALMNTGAAIAPPQAGPYYDVRVEVSHGDEHGTWGFVAVPGRDATRMEDGAWYEMTDDQAALFKKVGAEQTALPAAGLIGAAPPPEPKPATQPVDDGNLLWPEGILVALALAAGAFFVVRMLRRPGGLRPASG